MTEVNPHEELVEWIKGNMGQNRDLRAYRVQISCCTRTREEHVHTEGLAGHVVCKTVAKRLAMDLLNNHFASPKLAEILGKLGDEPFSRTLAVVQALCDISITWQQEIADAAKSKTAQPKLSGAAALA